MKKQICSLIFVFLSLALVLNGCSGGMVTKSIRPTPTPNVKYIPAENTVVLSGIKKVAIFPFADYSHQQDQLGITEWGGNIKILEEITDHLSSHGLSVIIQEDVNTLLVDQEVIKPVDKEKYLIYGTFEEEDQAHKIVGTPQHELNNYEHSPAMTEELLQVIKRENRKKNKKKSKSPILQGTTVGLTKEKVVDIAQVLGADLILRGRIIDYGFKDIGTLNPLYRGVIPVVIDGVKDIFFGATGSYGYEEDLGDIENMLVGAALGYAIGNNILDRSTSSSSSISNGLIARRVSKKRVNHDNYAMEGAGVGAVAGWMASQHPKKAKRAAVVQVRIYAQDGETGDVLWTNRVEIEYLPKSNFAYAETHPKAMFDIAVKESIKALMDSFFVEAESVLVENGQTALVQKEGL